MLLAKLDSNGNIDLRNVDNVMGSLITELRDAGFVNFVSVAQPETFAGYVAVAHYEIKDGKIVQSWTVEIDHDAVNAKIDALKAQITASDYKVTKCWEYSLVGQTLPYDINALHAERERIRDEINVLEAKIAQ